MLYLCTLLLSYHILTTAVPAPWDLPVFPDYLPSVPRDQDNTATISMVKKRIPYNIWIAVRQKSYILCLYNCMFSTSDKLLFLLFPSSTDVMP